MSDFQLLTGLSILISGYSQLRCGLQTYFWQRVVHLAWFSSVTHLCCLTFLREHFARNKVAYYWRLPGMITLVLMLVVAHVPTAHYVLDDAYPSAEPRSEDFATCYFNSHTPNDRVTENLYEAAQQRMVLSTVFLGNGMLNRLWHLFWTPTYVYVRVREICGIWTGKLLSYIHVWTLSKSQTSILVAAILYRPLLATLLAWRFTLDLISSMAFEVWWLVLSFSWGIINLWGQNTKDDGRLKWTFGQVMALLVLAAPIIASTEGYITGTTIGL